jgi:hypothetical protein
MTVSVCYRMSALRDAAPASSDHRFEAGVCAARGLAFDDRNARLECRDCNRLPEKSESAVQENWAIHRLSRNLIALCRTIRHIAAGRVEEGHATVVRTWRKDSFSRTAIPDQTLGEAPSSLQIRTAPDGAPVLCLRFSRRYRTGFRSLVALVEWSPLGYALAWNPTSRKAREVGHPDFHETKISLRDRGRSPWSWS